MEILCSNVDCPIYYKRIKVKKDIRVKINNFEKLKTIELEDTSA